MKMMLTVATVLSGVLTMGVDLSWALSSETSMLLELLKAKGVITQSEVAEFSKALEEKMAASTSAEGDHHHSVQSLADRVDRLEVKDKGIEALGGKVVVSGLVETEMTALREKRADGERINSNDVTLATAQLNVDATVNQYVDGRLVFLYEEGGSDTVGLDEAFVALKGGDDFPVYAYVGRQYVPFGRFESHFISDPGTLLLGETNDTAVVAGYASGIVDINIGGFKGKVKEVGASEHVNSVVASAILTMPQANENVSLSSGVSYLSNLATSDGLEAETTGNEVVDTVGGWSAFVSLGYADTFFFDAEYLGAVKDFAVGDFGFTDADNLRPEAWNLEAAARLCESAEFALRYGGSNGAGVFLPQDEYGAALLYNVFDSTNLTFEYLYQEFRDASNNNQGTVQLAIEF